MIELPVGVVPNSATVTLVDFGGVMRPPLGGPIQRVNRLGNRFRVALGLPPLRNLDVGRVVVARLLRAKTEGLRVRYPLVGITPGSPGLPKVMGADQAGSSLTINGCRPGYGVSEGYPLSIETDGQHYLHFAAGPSVANGDGEMDLALTPMLRTSPADNAAIHIARPMVEGLVTGDEWAWEYSLSKMVGISFEIEEAA